MNSDASCTRNMVSGHRTEWWNEHTQTILSYAPLSSANQRTFPKCLLRGEGPVRFHLPGNTSPTSALFITSLEDEKKRMLRDPGVTYHDKESGNSDTKLTLVHEISKSYLLHLLQDIEKQIQVERALGTHPVWTRKARWTWRAIRSLDFCSS